MLISKLFGKDHLTAEDLGGKDVTLTISGVAMENLYNEKTNREEPKPVISFIEMEQRQKKDPTAINKRFVLSAKVNAMAIKDGLGYGDDTEEWKGKPLTIFPTTCRLGRDPNKPCIRVSNDKGEMWDLKRKCWVPRSSR